MEYSVVDHHPSDLSSVPTSQPAPELVTDLVTDLVTGPSFADLGVPARLVQALTQQGVTSPFPIQAATIPDALAGRDVLGKGATGSGKSLAFLIPVIATLMASGKPTVPGAPRALVLAPTRELATQLDEALAPMAKAAGLRHMTIFGGVSANPQISTLRRGVDIVVACPGRLMDHLNSKRADLGRIEITVLDEADHMADLGFLPDVRRILDRTPVGSQRLLFSATLDNAVDVLVKRYLDGPVVHEVTPVTREVPIEHRIVRIDASSRLGTITELASTPGRVVIFTRTKYGARKLAKQLNGNGVKAVELHGDLSQNARRRNLAAFSDGSVGTLVATDIAARGIHVDDVELVVHADPPADQKAYTHRSGRTARAGAAGSVVTLALDEQLDAVRRMTGQSTGQTSGQSKGQSSPTRDEAGRSGSRPHGSASSRPRSRSRRPSGRSGRSGGRSAARG